MYAKIRDIMQHTPIHYTGPDGSAETISSIFEHYIWAATDKIGKELLDKPIVEQFDTVHGSWEPAQPVYGGEAELLPTVEAMRQIGAAPLMVNVDEHNTANGYAKWPALYELDPYGMAWATIDAAVREAVAAGAVADRLTLTLSVPTVNSAEPQTVGRWVRWAQGIHDCAVAYRTPIVAVNNADEFEVKAFGRIALPNLQPPVSGDAVYVVGNTAAEMGGSRYALLHGENGGLIPDALTEGLMRYRSIGRAHKQRFLKKIVPLGAGGLSGAIGRYAKREGSGLVLELNKLVGTVAHDDLLLFSESIGRMLLVVSADKVHEFELSIAAETFGRIGTVNSDPQLTIVGYDGDMLVDAPLASIYA